MRKIAILFIAPFLLFATLSAQITQTEADEIVKERLSNETNSYFLYAKEELQTEGATIATAAGEILELDYSCWVYYMSYYVSYNIEPPGKYLIVKASNGNLLEIKVKNDDVPDNLEEWRTVVLEFETTATIDPNKKWEIEFGYACPEGEGTGCFCYYNLGTRKIGDIRIFNGTEYYELLSNSNPQQQPWEVVTYVREEAGKVFFYVKDCDKEYLMYDYNLNVGDEVFLMDPLNPYSLYNQENPCELTEVDIDLYQFTVTKIGVMVYDGVPRKMLQLKRSYSYHTDVWVEGIGCMRGITYHISQELTGAKQLKNCYESDKLIFVNEKPEHCWIFP